MKRLLLVLVSLICIFSITACSIKDAAGSVDLSEFLIHPSRGGYDSLSNTTEGSIYRYGDVNMDGVVSNTDILILYKYIYNPLLYPIDHEVLGDTNQDGAINNADILNIYKHIYDPELYTLDLAPDIDPLNNNSHGEAYYIFEVFSFYGNVNGWNVDNRFDLYNTNGSKSYIMSDKSDEEFYSMSRDFDDESNGILRLELIADLASSNGGMYLSFKNPVGDDVVSITEEDGYLALVGSSKQLSRISVSSNTDSAGKYSIIFEVDLDEGTASALINNTSIGSVKISKDAVISRFECGTEKVGGGYVRLSHAELCKNYVLSERFLATSSAENKEPLLWDISGNVRFEGIGGEDERGLDRYSARIRSWHGEAASASRSFESIYGKIAFETFFLLPEKTDGAAIALTMGENEIIKFETKNGNLVIGDEVLHDYIANVWQNLHIEANTETGTADVYINGKLRTTVDFDAEYFDGVKFSFDPASSSLMYFDDVVLYNLFDYEDYPTEPQVAESTDYNVGVNVCWLWRDYNSGEGWQSTSGFSELDTYLGFYDEGLRETADWELKYMAEHGIDFINACWYGPTSYQNTPIKKMAVSYSALHDGYMYAKYSDLVDFSIMWENSSKAATTFDEFKEYIWNYWKEYYFSDPRYVRLDNKALLTVWNYENMVHAFGGVTVSEAIDFMNQELIDMGYDGIIILIANQGPQNAGTYQNYANNGIDGTYAYHYGPSGYMPEIQIDANRTNYQNSLGISHHIPTISTGFNDVARNDSRDPLIAPEDHLAVCEDVKAILAQYNTGTWKDNTVMISTWNEFSEGTYIFPCEQNGFTYLENIRTAFTNDTTDHSEIDVKPTEEQVDRVTHMYPDDHTNIRWLQFEKSDEDKRMNDVAGYTSVSNLTEKLSSWGVSHNVTSFTTYSWQGYIKGKSTSTDFGIKSTLSQPVSAADAPILHIQMESTTTGDLEVFFATTSAEGFVGERRVTTSIKETNKTVDYYINMASHSDWKDEITQLRIDPGDVNGSTFKIYKIELMNYPTKDPNTVEIAINHNNYNLQFYPVATDNGDYDVVGDAKNGFYSMMMLYHEWNRFTETLTIKTRDERTIVFTVGSDTITVNGAAKSLGYTFTLRDGLPVFRIKSLCDLLDYKYTVDGNKLLIQSCTDAQYEMLENRKDGFWGFDLAEFTDNWKGQNGQVSVGTNGTLVLTPTGDDNAVYRSVSFNASKYTKLIVGVKYFAGLEHQTPYFYFSKDANGAWSGANGIAGSYTVPTSVQVGDTVYVTFDLTSNDNWSGNITAIRIDAISGMYTHEFDSIELTK